MLRSNTQKYEKEMLDNIPFGITCDSAEKSERLPVQTS